jgi:hypothetical protein
LLVVEVLVVLELDLGFPVSLLLVLIQLLLVVVVLDGRNLALVLVEQKGSNPSIFSTITSTGGGGGGKIRSKEQEILEDLVVVDLDTMAGCNPGGTGNTPPTSPPQGNPGGLVGWKPDYHILAVVVAVLLNLVEPGGGGPDSTGVDLVVHGSSSSISGISTLMLVVVEEVELVITEVLTCRWRWWYWRRWSWWRLPRIASGSWCITQLVAAVVGVANPGGANGGSGGSGIVVVRYQIGSLAATAKATGGLISYASGKTIHQFLSSGTFTVTNPCFEFR